jgi:hypothetical protein
MYELKKVTTLGPTDLLASFQSRRGGYLLLVILDWAVPPHYKEPYHTNGADIARELE